MISKKQRNDILEKILQKEDKIYIANVIDKINISFVKNIITCTNFMNLSQIDKVLSILNKYKIKYYKLNINDNFEKSNLLFIPDNVSVEDLYKIYSNYISCIKIIPKKKDFLKHKDYMGSIYSLGLKQDVIGDIICKKDYAYVMCMKNIEDYILTNLITVGNQKVELESLDLFSDEVKSLDVEFIDTKVIVASMRADVILAEVYNLSRTEIKSKIQKTGIYINSSYSEYGSQILKIGNTISLKNHGKFKIENILRTTKAEKLEILIKKYS